MAKRKYTADQLLGINLGLNFLTSMELKKLGVETTWDAVLAINTIKPVIKTINDMGDKIRKDFFEEVNGEYRLKKGLDEEFNKANDEVNNKEFDLDLPQFEFSKIKDLEGLNGKHILQLQPILKR